MLDIWMYLCETCSEGPATYSLAAIVMHVARWQIAALVPPGCQDNSFVLHAQWARYLLCCLLYNVAGAANAMPRDPWRDRTR